jgi:transcriptional regulator with XRE-family HTH domain
VTDRHDFGEELRRLREQRGIALETIAQDTKIGKSLLAGLERGDCSRWPGGIYSRAYVRDYARAIGLDPGETLARFVACFEAPPGAAEAVSVPAPAAAPRNTSLRLTLAGSNAEESGVLMRARHVAADALIALAEWLRRSDARTPPRQPSPADRTATQSA